MTDYIRIGWIIVALVLSFSLPAVPAWSDKDLRAFVKAYVEYQKIRQNYEPKMNNTRDEKEKQKIQREGDDKVKQALEKQGLTPQAYNRLFVAVNGNPQLRQKALALINDERKKS
jgi:DNA-binding TFAR19-related protein (PDSD5 family)